MLYSGQLHIGGYRTALYNYLYAKKHNGKFILRLEDTDQSRLVPGAAELMEEILQWGEIISDESPQKGGPFGPYQQSKRLDLYHKAVNDLLERGYAYRCFCSEKRLDLLRKEAARNKTPNKYDGRCKHLKFEEIETKLKASLPYTVRFKLDPSCDGVFEDIIYGTTQHNPYENEGDPIILKSDGFPTYHLANVVDDHLMKITHVFRGVEWQISTPKHILMYQAFGWEPPKYGHLPVILNSDGTKLSKRQGDVHLEHYKAEGYFPDAIRNFVISTGGGFSDVFQDTKSEVKIRSIKEMSNTFDILNLRTNSSQLDFEKLKSFNRVSIVQKLKNPNEQLDLVNNARTHLEREFGQIHTIDDGDILRLLQLGCDRISKLSDLVSHPDFDFIWKRPTTLSLLQNIPKNIDPKILHEVTEIIANNLFNDFAVANKKIRKYCKSINCSYPEIMKCVRVYLVGRIEGPPVKEIILQLGNNEALLRLNSGLERHKENKSIQ